MPSSDRAFRALAQAEPRVVIALLSALRPGTIPTGAHVAPEDVDDGHLPSPPPTQDADWVARVGAGDVHHVECQGYRDGTFDDRVFRYHLNLVLRYRDKRVYTTALWLVRPPRAGRLEMIRHGDVTVRVRPVVLCEAPARKLLEDPLTACFAAGADRGTWSERQLCRKVVTALVEANASFYQRHLAVVAAAMQGRYEEMVSAMNDVDMGPIVIEDLVKFGEDRGLKKGREEGLERGLERGREEGACGALRAAVIEAADARGIRLTVADRKRIGREGSVEQLTEWLRRALRVANRREVFAA